jgi:hypothetical protein
MLLSGASAQCGAHVGTTTEWDRLILCRRTAVGTAGLTSTQRVVGAYQRHTRVWQRMVHGTCSIWL